MISLELAKQHLSTDDFEKFENLYCICSDEEYLSAQWYTTREMMDKILQKYHISDNDPYDME